jgi:hypothetical protein
VLGLESHASVHAMAERCVALAPDDLHLHRRLQQLAERSTWPSWARLRPGQDVFSDDSVA